MFADPNVIKLFHGQLDDLRIIGQDACLEVALIAALHADACPREVSATDIHLLAVKHQHLEVNSGTQHSIQPVIKYWIAVKVGREVSDRKACLKNLHPTG